MNSQVRRAQLHHFYRVGASERANSQPFIIKHTIISREKPFFFASVQGAATQALQRRHSGALCRAKSIHGELAGVGMCMWLAAAAWLASMVPGLSASAQGAATQALQRRHSGPQAP